MRREMLVLNVKYNNIDSYSALKQIMEILHSKSKSDVFFLNYDCIYKAQLDEEYKNAINAATLVLSDGIGLSLLTRLYGGKMKDNCNGTDFCPFFITQASKKGYKIFFLGGQEGVAAKAAEYIRKKILNVRIVGTHCGYFKDDNEVINKINNSQADVLFVGMGVPLQEKWILKNREKLNPRLCLGVGALFDYLSGSVPRAPAIMRVLHMEWVWRILLEPKRMIKRYIIDGAKLFWLVLQDRLFDSYFKPRSV